MLVTKPFELNDQKLRMRFDPQDRTAYNEVFNDRDKWKLCIGNEVHTPTIYFCRGMLIGSGVDDTDLDRKDNSRKLSDKLLD